MDRGVWTAKTVKRPRQQPAQPQYANYWAPLTRKRHTIPHPAQPRHTNDWAPRTRKRHRQEHRPQRPTERSDPTQHAKGRTGDCPGPRKGATTRRNVTWGVSRRWGRAGLLPLCAKGGRCDPAQWTSLRHGGTPSALRACQGGDRGAVRRLGRPWVTPPPPAIPFAGREGRRRRAADRDTRFASATGRSCNAAVQRRAPRRGCRAVAASRPCLAVSVSLVDD